VGENIKIQTNESKHPNRGMFFVMTGKIMIFTNCHKDKGTYLFRFFIIKLLKSILLFFINQKEFKP
jgi:hypothetical protein